VCLTSGTHARSKCARHEKLVRAQRGITRAQAVPACEVSAAKPLRGAACSRPPRRFAPAENPALWLHRRRCASVRGRLNARVRARCARVARRRPRRASAPGEGQDRRAEVHQRDAEEEDDGHNALLVSRALRCAMAVLAATVPWLASSPEPRRRRETQRKAGAKRRATRARALGRAAGIPMPAMGIPSPIEEITGPTERIEGIALRGACRRRLYTGQRAVGSMSGGAGMSCNRISTTSTSAPRA
jgi:hypothetical protein